MDAANQKPVVGIGSRVDYMGRHWIVKWITRIGVLLTEVRGGSYTGRETLVALSVFELIA